MELRHLRYFLAVAEELHFGRAAEKLGIKQPPLSRQIKDLEEELGVRLFDRTNRRVELTPSGRYLKQSAARIGEQADQIRNTIGRIHEGTAGLVRIGYVGSAMHSILPCLLRTLYETYPKICTELHELDGAAQVQALRSGELDIGFVWTPIQASGLATHILREEPFAVVLPAENRLSKAEAATLRPLAEIPYIGFSRTCAPGLTGQILHICNEAGFSPHIVHETSQLNTLLRLVEAGFAYSIVPSSVKVGYNLALRFIDLSQSPHRAQLSAIHASSIPSGAARTLLDLMERIEF